FQQSSEMPGLKRKMARRFLPHEPEKSEDSDSDPSEDDSYDELNYKEQLSPNEDEWEENGSVESGVVEAAEEMEHVEEVGKPQPERVMAVEPARVVVADAAPAASAQPQRVVIDDANETESQMEERVEREFQVGVAQADRTAITVDPPCQATISAAEQALAKADPN
ncbi:MAG: hypothetical protein GY847_28480, partial [Proteobacteria bacterium]|nr:hypothetical protein [Pseudomonadota bacterium]